MEPVMYLIHDVVGNNEEQITNFDSELLQNAADAGMLFIAVYEDGTRKQVPVESVHEPQLFSESVFPVITYQLWKEAMDPLKEMMAESMTPALKMLPTSVSTKVETPYERFLSALKKIDDIFKEADNGETA